MHEQNLGADGVCTRKQRGTTVHIFALLPQFRISAVFISKVVRLHGVLPFQNKHMSGNLRLLMRKCSDIIFKWESTKLKCYIFMQSCGMQQEHEVPTQKMMEMLLCVCVCGGGGGLQNRMHMFPEYFLSFATSNITEKVQLTKKGTGKTSVILCRGGNANCLHPANLYSRTVKPSTKTCVF